MRLDVLYRKGIEQLEEAKIPEARLDAWYLLGTAASVSRSDLYVHPEREISMEAEEQFLEWIRRRSERIPIQRILGEQEFMGLSFLVGENVLIPRQDTEILVETALGLIEREKSTSDQTGNGETASCVRILDMCTGTGCIALSIAAISDRKLHVTAVDLSEEAVRITAKNRERLHIDPARVEILQSDLFDQVTGTYRMIVSNPPYIRPDVIAGLEPEVREHDPILALDGGVDGLDFYRAITEHAAHYLEPGGYLLYEIGYDQAEDVRRILTDRGYEEITVIQDLTGKDRVVTARRV